MAGPLSHEDAALAYWKANPVDAVKDWFSVTPDDYQGDILNDIVANDRLVAKSAHGAGKSTTLSWAGWHFLNCYENSRVVATAPTFSQLHDVLWPEYAKWHAQMVPNLARLWTISGGHIRRKATKAQPALDKVWFAVARTSNKPENVQGFHNTNLMIQGDEGSAIPPPVFEVLEGALSEATDKGGTSKLMLMGNPNFTAGEFFDAFNKNKQLYTRYTLTGDPQLLIELGVTQGQYHKEHGKVYYAERVSQKYRLLMERKYGRLSAVYDVRVRGVFPKMDDKSVIPLEWAERAAQVELPVFDLVGDGVTIVMDVARFGGDETVLGLFRRGHCIFIQAWAKTSTNQSSDIIMEKIATLQAQGLTVLRVIIDEPGVGGGVIDNLRRDECPVPIVPYNGGRPLKHNEDGTGDSLEDCRMFANVRTRDWWYLRRKTELGQMHIPEDETTINQMASVQYAYNEKEKIQVESKKKMRERLGDEASPDRADVIVMGSAPWVSTGQVNTDISETDVIMGADRPTDELGMEGLASLESSIV